MKKPPSTCLEEGCLEPAEPNIDYCRAHEGGFIVGEPGKTKPKCRTAGCENERWADPRFGGLCGTCLNANPLGDQSRKADAGKHQFRLLPWTELREVVRVLEFGAKKYSEGGWRKVDNARNRYLDAAFRHLAAYADGEELDPESGLHHIAHAACCVLFLLRFK